MWDEPVSPDRILSLWSNPVQGPSAKISFPAPKAAAAPHLLLPGMWELQEGCLVAQWKIQEGGWEHGSPCCPPTMRNPLGGPDGAELLGWVVEELSWFVGFGFLKILLPT